MYRVFSTSSIHYRRTHQNPKIRRIKYIAEHTKRMAERPALWGRDQHRGLRGREREIRTGNRRGK